MWRSTFLFSGEVGTSGTNSAPTTWEPTVEGGSALWVAAGERAARKLERGKLASAFDVFIGCFTPERDGDQHWLDFGQDSFAIGFRTLSEELVIPQFGYGLFEVEYDTTALRSRLDATHARLRTLARETHGFRAPH
ncbi:MAG: hypothetical protein SFV15_23865 [Polyangiaceae bacterium]|nr:hypothetical protein [Polyangiaceae bacterium]